MSNNILIGSGLSSLGFLENIDKSKNFILYDKNSYIGGHAYSFEIENFFYDEGAHISHSNNEEFLEYIDAKNDKKFREFKSIVYNFYKGKKIGYPIQLNLKDLNFFEKINYFFAYFFKNKKISNNRNYYEWLLSSYGSFLTDKYYKMYTDKYWRTDMKKMSVDWIKGRLAEKNLYDTLMSLFFKNPNNSLVYNKFRYPVSGGFFNAFKKKYEKFNFNLNHKVTKIDINSKKIYFSNGKNINYNILVSSIPINEYSDLIEELPSWARETLKSLKFTKLITYNYKLKRKIDHDFHWCYFYDKNIPISRMSILSNLNPNKQNENYFVQAEVFYRNDENIDISEFDKKTRDHIIKFFRLNDDKDLIFEKKVFIEKAYPIPLIGYTKKIDDVISWLKKNKIYPIGLYGNWRFMWSDQTFINGKKIADEINDNEL